MKLKFVRSEVHNNYLYTFWFQPENKLNYQAGQFANFRIPHENTDNRGSEREFTISSSPTEELIAFTTNIGSNSSTFKKHLLKLRVGEEISMDSPIGDFILPADKAIKLIFIAGGTGITPLRSIIKYLKDTGQQRDIELNHLHTLTSKSLFYDLLTAQPIVYRQLDSNNPNSFNVNLLLPVEDYHRLIYVSGSPRFVDLVKSKLIDTGIDKQNIVTDEFLGLISD